MIWVSVSGLVYPARCTSNSSAEPSAAIQISGSKDTLPWKLKALKHIVVAMMENHSYDNRLGMLHRRGADGFTLGRDGLPTATNPYANGDLQHAFHMPTTCQITGGPSQEWRASHIQFANGRNDGFVMSPGGPVSMGYWDRGDQPFYYSVAEIFPIADRYFCSVLGQTYPNRRYLMSATSLGMVDDILVNDYPPNGTIFDKLNAAHITWRDYYTTLPTTLLYPALYTKYHGTRILPVTRFFTDAAAGKLPGFCFVEPRAAAAGHPARQRPAGGAARRVHLQRLRPVRLPRAVRVHLAVGPAQLRLP
jgi:phospholipase C